MEELLDTLRDYVQNRRQIKEVNGKICLGDRYYSKTLDVFPVKLMQGKRKINKDRKFYKLGEILFFLQNRSLSHDDYIKKAQEKKLRCVMRPDRKAILNRICGPTSKTRSSAFKDSNNKKSDAPAVGVAATSPAPFHDQGTKDEEKSKPHLRTYSRKRSSHELRTSSRRQSLVNDDQSSDMDIASADSDELAFFRNENESLERSLKSVASFLKDHLGVSNEQLEAIQEAESNTIELSNIACQIKNSIVHANVIECNPTDIAQSKYCYRAVKHRTRGWEMSKQSLSSVLAGHDEEKEIVNLEEPHVAALDNCLEKGSLHLKRAFSVLISQIREFNKPAMTSVNSAMVSDKVIKDCLSEAIEHFRNLFKDLLSSEKTPVDRELVEKWVDVSRAELGKLFHSLAVTLQSLRDLPSTPQKQPNSFFHLPEPTFSLALNPAKVQHSVLLEMYLRMGLAELRSILMQILGYSPECSEVKSNNNYEIIHQAGDVADQNRSYEKSFLGSTLPQNQDFGQDEKVDAGCPPTSASASDTDAPSNFHSDSSSHLLDGLLIHRNGAPKSYKNCNSSSQAARQSSESDCQQYSVFKASLGNTLVSSFKKQIQEKIQASSDPAD